MTLRVAIITDDPGWHGKRLREAFQARGVECLFSSLQQARIELGRTVSVVLPGFEAALPDAVFVRGIPGGTLQQVVFHLNVLHILKELGVRVYNDGRAIERSVDKAWTSARLSLAEIPTPATWICTDRQMTESVVQREAAAGHALICKPLFGSQGQGIVRVTDCADLPEADAMHHVWYLQRFIPQTDQLACDWRVFVISGVAVAAMRRSTSGWLANVAQGGTCQAALPEGELKQLAEQAVACLDMDYAGVDLMRDVQGNWWVIEINSVPAWRGLQRVTAVNIADALADDLLAKVRCAEPCEALR
ncbi:ATP-grasp domain-containing protein [Sedimenticola thiotaurini]|uniref:Alpha-L-glutamate ligase n=1 Tax=Sedimenticola thiotaurini TaxID=1543721 RepID=A0A0F7JWT3_9GAMM|nr:RimK family alpha-L-glutamate ligase [Sedimenticola thiotaurini]AKH19260.1 alpha-L-glutamate ligase [Sedimenticola thiotaurini]